MSDNFQLALLQHEPTPANVDISLARLSEYATIASSAGANVLLVPEASLTGYNISPIERDLFAEEADGRIREAVAEICLQNSIAISYGYIEKNASAFYNAVQLIDQSGKTLSHYRKTHLWGDLDRALFTPGDSFSSIVELDGWKIGLLICYDVEFPECVRELALNGAEIVLVSTALMSPWTQVADLVVPTRAYESQVYIAYANYCGNENGIDYVGHSCIAAPDGEVLAKAGSDSVLLNASLSRTVLNNTRQALPYHRDRRPELYTDLSR